MSIGIVCVGVVQVVGRNEGQAEVGSQSEKVSGDTTLNIETVVHNLDKKVLRAKNVTKLGSGISRGVILPETEAGLNFTAGTSGSCNQAGGVAAENLAVHARLEVKTLQRRQRRQLEEVVHALGG